MRKGGDGTIFHLACASFRVQAPSRVRAPGHCIPAHGAQELAILAALGHRRLGKGETGQEKL